LVRIDLLSILIESNSWRRSTVTPPFSRTNPDDLRVDSAGDAVLEFQVHLWYRILIEHGGVRDVTDGSGLNHVANGEPLDGFVFRGTSGKLEQRIGLTWPRPFLLRPLDALFFTMIAVSK